MIKPQPSAFGVAALFLEVTKTAETRLQRSFDWSIRKSAAVAEDDARARAGDAGWI